MKGEAAVAAALKGIQAAFDDAARQKVALIRELAALEPPAHLADAHRALSEALLRTVAANADGAASDDDRRAQVAAQSGRAEAAVARIGAAGGAFADAVQRVTERLRATDGDALDACERHVRGLGAHTTPEVAAAATAYVAALRATFAPGAGDDAFVALAAAQGALERVLASG